VFVTSALEGKAGVRRLLGRMVQWRVGLRWYLAALVSFFVVFFAVYVVHYQGASMAALIEKSPLLVTAFLPGILSQLLIPSLGEEPGWRGFALPRLQAQYGPVAASLVLGALHGLWHMPVMFTFALGPFSATTLITFVLTAIGGTVIYAWITNNARGSILIAMLIHAASNSASQFLTELLPADTPKSALAQALGDSWVVTLAFVMAAVLLVVATRGRLGYRPAPPAPEA
jgi:membrane protease YdiL (CAAX protease family)